MTLDMGLFFVFFVYGLAFIGMGLAMAMESWRASALAEARVLAPLAGFGLIHGAHEWLESYLMLAQSFGAPLPAWLPWLRLGLLTASFSSLLLFAFQSLRLVGHPAPAGLKHGGIALGAYIIFIVTSATITYSNGEIPIQHLADGMARYLLAVPSSTLAALGLHYLGRNTGNSNRALKWWLNGAAIGFGLYALTQLFVHPIAMFPASVLNDASFRTALGFPIQVVRTVMAALITVCLLRATQVTDESRKSELLVAQQAHVNTLVEQQELRRALLRHIVRAQEDERARIAHELHDETAQTLTAFALELASLKKDLRPGSASIRTVERLLDLSQKISQGLYRIMTDLRPAQLDELGLAQAIHALVDREYKGFTFPIEVTGAARRLDPIIETVLFRVAQEALTNIARHARVRNGCVQIIYEDGRVVMSIRDEGRGFDPEEDFHAPRGWGLAGMKERVESVGGILRIESAPTRGASIEVAIPLPPDGKEQE